MNSAKKYIIEFFVIVLGVSVSFLAEQWRQDMNTRQERDELIEKAKNELKLLLDDDSIYESRSSEAWLRKFIFEKSTLNADTFLVELGDFMNGGDVTHRWPNLILVAQRRDLDPKVEGNFRLIYQALEVVKEIDDDTKKNSSEKYWAFYQKYNIDYDIMNINHTVIEEKRKGNLDFDPFAFVKKMKKRGNYAGFFQDAEVQLILRELYSNLLANRYAMAVLKVLYKDLIQSKH